MLFAASRPEVQSMLGLVEQKPFGSGWKQERNMICNLKNPPDCFYEDEPFGPFGNAFDTSLKTGSPYQTPSRKDFEDEMKPGEGGPPSDFNIQDYLLPIKKAEVPETWNEGTGIEKGGYENAPQWLRDQLWKQDLKRRQELGLEPVVS